MRKSERIFLFSWISTHTSFQDIGIHKPDIILSLWTYNTSGSWSLSVKNRDHVTSCSWSRHFLQLKVVILPVSSTNFFTQFFMWVLTGKLWLVVTYSENFPKQDSCEQNKRCPQKNSISSETFSVCCFTEVSSDQEETNCPSHCALTKPQPSWLTALRWFYFCIQVVNMSKAFSSMISSFLGLSVVEVEQEK